MNAWLQKSSVRLALVTVVLIAGLGALRVLRTGSLEETAVEPFEPVDAVPAVSLPQEPQAPVETPLTLEALGAPNDPLPAALPGIPDADTLARQVLAGTQASLPALMAALQASGIGVLGPENVEDAKPSEPWQGIAMQRWEVRLAAAMVLPQRGISLSLPDLAAFLIAAMPELKGAPVEQLIVSDLRALADSPTPTTQFFGRFIAALGRHAVSHDPYDLNGTVDPQTMRLDGLQTSLVLRRLAIDILRRSGDANGQSTAPAKKNASIIDALDEWLMPAAHAQEGPCRFSERTQTIMDIAGLGSTVVWGGFQIGDLGMSGILDRPGMARASRAAAIASTVLAYAQFIAAYAALEVETTIDQAPLVRTKQGRPQSGERRELSATVTMDLGNAEMLNCFRALLILAGFDFSVPNNGPVKGARVLWYGVDGFDQAAQVLHGGSEAIVQFVAPEGSRIQVAGSGSSSPVTGAVTGDDGKVHIGVEGRGQNETLDNDARPVPKTATVRLHVALNGSDLFRDVREAAGTAAGGLVGLLTVPLSVLTRAQWAAAGHFTFPVKDWSEGPPQWSGTISVVETSISLSSGEGSFGSGAHTMQETETQELKVTVTDGVDESGTEAHSSLGGQSEGRYTRLKTYAAWTLGSCGSIKSRRMQNNSRETSTGSGSGDAAISVSLSDDGSYAIGANSSTVVMPLTGQTAGTLEVFRSGAQDCYVAVRTDTNEHVPLERSVGGLIQVGGRVDPKAPNVLAGSKTEESSQGGMKRVKTTTWRFNRH
jgi:hypothetical protein